MPGAGTAKRGLFNTFAFLWLKAKFFILELQLAKTRFIYKKDPPPLTIILENKPLCQPLECLEKNCYSPAVVENVYVVVELWFIGIKDLCVTFNVNSQ